MADVTGGHNGIETRMGVAYTDGVVNQGMSLERFVDITSANAAKILGLYPQKGAIAAGSDADITIIDPSIDKRLELSDLHLEDYSIWEGWPVSGWPVTTLLRGKLMVEDGRLLGSAGDGRWVARKVAEEYTNGPALLTRPTSDQDIREKKTWEYSQYPSRLPSVRARPSTNLTLRWTPAPQ